MNDLSAYLFGTSFGLSLGIIFWLCFLIKFDVINLINFTSNIKKQFQTNEEENK